MTEAQFTQISGQPVLILKEGTNRSSGREAQRANITAAKVIAETVKSSLGPKGMDKMLVDGLGDITITSDGATILKEMDVQHPAAKMMKWEMELRPSSCCRGNSSRKRKNSSIITFIPLSL